jgi:hypothetical protein
VLWQVALRLNSISKEPNSSVSVERQKDRDAASGAGGYGNFITSGLMGALTDKRPVSASPSSAGTTIVAAVAASVSLRGAANLCQATRWSTESPRLLVLPTDPSSTVPFP